MIWCGYGSIQAGGLGRPCTFTTRDVYDRKGSDILVDGHLIEEPGQSGRGSRDRTFPLLFFPQYHKNGYGYRHGEEGR